MSAFDLLGGLVLEDGRAWAEASTEWQRADAQAVLDLAGDAARLHFLTRPRGGSKTTDIAGVLVAALLDQFPARAQGYAIATDSDQAALLLDAAAGMVERSGLTALLDVQTRRLVHRHSGAAVTMAQNPGSRGPSRRSVPVPSGAPSPGSGWKPPKMSSPAPAALAAMST